MAQRINAVIDRFEAAEQAYLGAASDEATARSERRCAQLLFSIDEHCRAMLMATPSEGRTVNVNVRLDSNPIASAVEQRYMPTGAR